MLNKKKNRGNDSNKHPRGTYAPNSRKFPDTPRNLPTENTSMAANTVHASNTRTINKEERKQERDRS